MDKVIHYRQGEFVIHWKPDLCQHSGNCVKGSPQVFKPRERPWVKVNQATEQELMRTIDTCPSGALTYTEKSPE